MDNKKEFSVEERIQYYELRVEELARAIEITKKIMNERMEFYKNRLDDLRKKTGTKESK